MTSSFFRGDGGALDAARREGQSAPDGNGVLLSFLDPALNASGQMAFVANLIGTSGGASDNFGIFLANGIDTIQVVREGQTLGFSTITGLVLSPGTGPVGPERRRSERFGPSGLPGNAGRRQ